MQDHDDSCWNQFQLEEERRMLDERGHVFVPHGPVPDFHRDGGDIDVGRIFGMDPKEEA